MIKLIKSSFHNEKDTKEKLSKFILETDILSMNEQCSKFEKAFAEKQKRKHAVYVSNGSVANLLLIQALLNMGTLKKGDNVGISALTWPTNVMPIIQLGLNPVALDCSLETLNISPEILKPKLKDIQALFITNVLGFCDNISEIKSLCDENNVLFIEDNCESLGSESNDVLLGNFGLASTFSMFVGHHMSTIEGGMICTDSSELYEQLVISRAHGWDRNLSPESQQRLRKNNDIDDFYAKYTFYDVASNFRPNEINGFIGNIQINYWDEIVSKRANNFDRYYNSLLKNDDFYRYNLDHMNVISNFSMPLICKSAELAKKYREKFDLAEVEIRPVIAGDITKQPFYKKYVSENQDNPNSELVHNNGFYFGNNPDMTDEEISTLCELVETKA